MSTKKETTKSKQKKTTVASAPDLETRRKVFQETASGKRKATPAKSTAQQPSEIKPIRRSRILGVMIVLLVVFVPLIAFAAFYTAYRSPDRMVADAIMNTLSSEKLSYSADVTSPTRQLATIHGKHAGGQAQIDATIKTTYPGELSTVNVALFATQKDMFFNVPNASSLIAKGMPATERSLYESIQPIVKSDVDGKWMYVQQRDLMFVQPLTKLSSCATNSLRSLASNIEARRALITLYRQSPFLETKHIQSIGSTGMYQATINQARFNTFLDNITRAGNVVPFGKCTQEVAAIKKSALHASVFELSIDETSRTLQKMTVAQSGEQPLTTTIVVDTDKEISLKEPDGAVRFDDIKNKLIRATIEKQVQ